MTPTQLTTVQQTEKLIERLIKTVNELGAIADLNGYDAIKPISKSLLIEAVSLIELARRAS